MTRLAHVEEVVRVLDAADVPKKDRRLRVAGRPAWIEQDIRDGWLQETDTPGEYLILDPHR